MKIPALVLEWLDYKAIDHEEISRDDKETEDTRIRHRLKAETCREILEMLQELS